MITIEHIVTRWMDRPNSYF